MNLVIAWRRNDPPITLAWRGPDGCVAAAALANSQNQIATIIGPPGIEGPAGPAGPIAEIIDGGTFN